MKGFKHTGRGPRQGHSFPKAFGFGASGDVTTMHKEKTKASYPAKKPGKFPIKKAEGGIIQDNIVEAPGFSDFKKGGKAHAKHRAALSQAGKLLRKARGGKVAGVSDPMTPKQAMSHSVGFNRTPKIGK